MKRMIFATKNKGKMKEVKEIMSDMDIEVVSMEEAGVDIDVIEDGKTFAENAMKKAIEIMNVTKEIVLADDSGLEIDFLDKAPGVYSARYMGADTPYDVKNKKILEMLEGIEEQRRSARYVCVIAAAFPNGTQFFTEGIMEGMIGFEARGGNGFGYDPIFYVKEYGISTAEMPPKLKNEISHRGNALAKMKEKLKGYL